MLVLPNPFLSLKVILTQDIDKPSYFFDWAKATGCFDDIHNVLFTIEDELRLLDRPCDSFIYPSHEYTCALDCIETDPNQLSTFLEKYGSIGEILFPKIEFFQKVNADFYAHFTERLLPLKTIILQSVKAKSDLHSPMEAILSDLNHYFSNDLRAFIHVFESFSKDSINDLNDFLSCHPKVTIILIRHIQSLDKLNDASFPQLEIPKYIGWKKGEISKTTRSLNAITIQLESEEKPGTTRRTSYS